MRKILNIVFVALAFLSLSSCFEILEETKVNSDGSGNHSLKINMSQSKLKLASIMELDSIQGHKVPKEVDIVKKLNSIKNILNGTEGIANAKVSYDFDAFIFGVSYDYDSIPAMKQAIWNVAKANKGKAKDSVLIFSSTNFENNTYKRIVSIDFIKAFNKLKEEDKNVISDATYTWIGRFDKEITSSSNANTKISKSKRAFMLKSKLSDIIFGSNSIENSIELKE